MKKDIHGGDIWKAAAELGIPAQSLIDFSASINPFGLPRPAASAIKKGLDLSAPYPEPCAGSFASALSDFYGVPEEEILPANGSTELIYLIPQAFKPKKALIIEPAFSEYASSLSLYGCRADGLVLREREDFRLDIGRLGERLKKGYSLVYFCNPANPTGAPYSRDEVIEAARVCARHSSVLIVDEAFADFNEEVSIKADAARLKNVVVLRSMTKFFSMAGLRLGFLVSNKKLVKRVSGFKPPWSVNTLALLAGKASLRDSTYIAKTLRWLVAERVRLFKGLSGIEGLKPYPSSANYLMVRSKAKRLGAPVLKRVLARQGLLIRDLSAFKGLGPEYFRLAVRTRNENEKLLKCLTEAFEKLSLP